MARSQSFNGKRPNFKPRCMRCGTLKGVVTCGKMDWCKGCRSHMVQNFGIKVLSEN